MSGGREFGDGLTLRCLAVTAAFHLLLVEAGKPPGVKNNEETKSEKVLQGPPVIFMLVY